MRKGILAAILLLFVVVFAYWLDNAQVDKDSGEHELSHRHKHRVQNPVAAPPPSRSPPRIRRNRFSSHSRGVDDEEEKGSNGEVAAAEAAEAEARRCATAVRPDCGFLDPSAAELVEMARCGTVKSDYPGGVLSDYLSEFPLPQKTVELAELSAREKEQIVRVTNNFRETMHSELGMIMRDLDGSQDQADALTIEQLVASIRKHSVSQEAIDARKNIARARADLAPLPAPATPTERFEQLVQNLGDTYEARLAEELGSARAAELRAINDGWPGGRNVSSGRCDEEAEDES